MALGGVFMSDTDGNIGTNSTTSTEKVTGLLFDISKQAKFFEEGAGLAVKDKLQGNVIEINSMDDLKELGIAAPSDDPKNDLLFGVPYYHINHFFSIQGDNGRLFIMFANCGADWNAIDQMQHAAHGMINQLGVCGQSSLCGSKLTLKQEHIVLIWLQIYNQKPLLWRTRTLLYQSC